MIQGYEVEMVTHFGIIVNSKQSCLVDFRLFGQICVFVIE